MRARAHAQSRTRALVGAVFCPVRLYCLSLLLFALFRRTILSLGEIPRRPQTRRAQTMLPIMTMPAPSLIYLLSSSRSGGDAASCAAQCARDTRSRTFSNATSQSRARVASLIMIIIGRICSHPSGSLFRALPLESDFCQLSNASHTGQTTDSLAGRQAHRRTDGQHNCCLATIKAGGLARDPVGFVRRLLGLAANSLWVPVSRLDPQPRRRRLQAKQSLLPPPVNGNEIGFQVEQRQRRHQRRR